jgi:hypothetical protein
LFFLIIRACFTFLDLTRQTSSKQIQCDRCTIIALVVTITSNSNKTSFQQPSDRWQVTTAWRGEEKLDSILDQPHPMFDVIKKNYPHSYYFTGKSGHTIYIDRPGQVNMKALKKANVKIKDLLFHFVYLTGTSQTEMLSSLNETIHMHTYIHTYIHTYTHTHIHTYTHTYRTGTSCAKFHKPLTYSNVATKRIAEFLWNEIDRSQEGRTISVLDLAGVGFRDMVGEVMDFVKKASAISQEHYPERSFKIYIVNSPRFFATTWRLIKPWLAEETVKKISINRTPPTVSQVFLCM